MAAWGGDPVFLSHELPKAYHDAQRLVNNG